MNENGLESRAQVKRTRKLIRKFRKHKRVLRRMFVIGGFLGTDHTDPILAKAQLESVQGAIDMFKAQIKDWRYRQSLPYLFGQQLAQVPWW